MKINNQINHVGLIADGARRWAKKNRRSLVASYGLSMQLMFKTIEFLYSNNVNIVSLYLLSKENLNRKQNELDAVIEAEMSFIDNDCPLLSNSWGCKIQVVGDKSLLTKSFSDAIIRIENLSKDKQHRKLYLLIGYDPVDEITIGAMQSETKEIFLDSLWVKEKVDLIIRTGGGQLLSNFLPLQSGYAHLVFLEELFNDMDINTIQTILDNFRADRKRLFGV